MKIEKIPSFSIPDDSIVRLKSMGNISEIMYSEKHSRGGCICKINKDFFADMRTGEVKEFRHLQNRADDLQNVAKTLSAGRDLLNANITDVRFCRWITLTYAENMTEPKRLYKDFENFNVRCRKIFGHYEYITAAEPQGRGAWHLHVVLIFGHHAPYMPNDVVSQCWKKGFVTVKRLDDVDNVGAYLTAYLGDMELTDENKSSILTGRGVKTVEFEENGEKKTKRFIKGARLCMYPPGFHIFRYSKGIKKPSVSHLSYKKALETVLGSMTYTKSVHLEDTENDYSNTYQYQYYNSLRSNNND